MLCCIGMHNFQILQSSLSFVVSVNYLFCTNLYFEKVSLNEGEKC